MFDIRMLECCGKPPFAVDDVIQMMPCPPSWKPSLLATRAISNNLTRDVFVKLLKQCDQVGLQTIMAPSPHSCGMWCAAGLSAGVGLIVIIGLVFVWITKLSKQFRKVSVTKHMTEDVSKINMQIIDVASQPLPSTLNFQMVESSNRQVSQSTNVF